MFTLHGLEIYTMQFGLVPVEFCCTLNVGVTVQPCTSLFHEKYVLYEQNWFRIIFDLDSSYGVARKDWKAGPLQE